MYDLAVGDYTVDVRVGESHTSKRPRYRIPRKLKKPLKRSPRYYDWLLAGQLHSVGYRGIVRMMKAS